MNIIVVILCAAGVLTPALLALFVVGSPLLSGASAVVALLIEMLCVMMWLDNRAEQKVLDRRIRRVAAPLSGERPADESEAGELSVFREQRAKSWLLDTLDRRFSMIDVRQSLPKAIGLAVLGAIVAGVGAIVADFGWLAVLLVPAGGLGAGWLALARQDAGQRTRFIELFPEAVDHVVRLVRAGLPSVEAMAVVAEEAPAPVSTVMRPISESVSAGMDPETVIRQTAAHVRIPEFTLFSAAVCLQMSTGGGISGALGNLSETLRGRHASGLKAKGATAQTRLTLAIISAVPVVVVGVQNFTNPQAVETLFQTESGASLLRYGIGCIVVGLLVARGLAARATRG